MRVKMRLKNFCLLISMATTLVLLGCKKPSAEDGENIPAYHLFELFCVSDSDCWIGAGGALYRNQNNSDYGWKQVKFPFAIANQIGAIFCSATDNCLMGMTSETTLARNRTGTDNGFFEDEDVFGYNTGTNEIYCSSPNSCWMANTNGQIALNTTGANGGWQVANLPAGNTWITKIECLSDSDCWAVSNLGVLRNSTGTVNGWYMAGHPPGYVSGQGHWNSLACLSSTDCWFLYGDQIVRNTSGADNGARFVASSYGDGSGNVSAQDIHCNGSADCWIVGSSYGEVLIARNSTDGDNDFVRIDLGGLAGQLTKITCTSPTNCIAIGRNIMMRNRTGTNNGWYVVQ